MQSNSKILSAFVGIFVLAALISLALLGLHASNINGFKASDTFELKAYFSDVSGLGKNARITLAGVQIGKVKSISMDATHNFEALLIAEIDSKYNNVIPDDSSLEILTAGLLGEKYLGITIGGNDTFLSKENDTFQITGSSIVLEKLIQKVITQMGMKE